MRRLDIPRVAARAGERLMTALGDLSGVAEVRGLGLLIAAQLDEGRDAKAVVAACLADGLVVNAVTPTALRLAPPLTVSDAEIDDAVAILAKVLGA
jgi:acetylornithine/succinyldiaminopimelate/putrescine aminotransferase